MTSSRIIRKKNIIAWSLRELKNLVDHAEHHDDVPPVIRNTIQMLEDFLNADTTTWADFQSENGFKDWNHDLDLINKIRRKLILDVEIKNETGQIIEVDSFMRQEGKHHYKKEFYDVIEAMLLGFTEQWPSNNLEAIPPSSNESKETNKDIPVSFFAPLSVCSYRLTTLASEVPEGTDEEPRLAQLTLEGYWINKEEKKPAFGDKSYYTTLTYLSRDYRNLGNVVEDEDKPLTDEQKNLITEGRVAGSVAGMALPTLYLMTATITGPLAPAVLMIGILSYTTLLGVTALAGSFIGKKIATRYIRQATPVPIVMEQNTKIDDLFKTLDDHSKNEISAVDKNNRVTPVATSSSLYLTSSFSEASPSREEKKFDSQQIAPPYPTAERVQSSTTRKRQRWLDGLQRNAATPAPVIDGALAPQINSDLAPTSRRSPSLTTSIRQPWLDRLQRSAATPAHVIDGALGPQISSNLASTSRKPH